MSDIPPTPPDQSKAEHIIAYRIATWSERSENPGTLPGMTEAEIKAYYLGRLQEAQAMIDLLNAINRGQDVTWAMPTSSNAEKALETAQSQITTLRAKLDELKETHLRMCATLRECVQKHHLGLGGENLDTLVVQRIEAQTAAIQEAQSMIAELMLLGSLELPYRRSAALLRAEEVNAHLQTFLPSPQTTQTPPK